MLDDEVVLLEFQVRLGRGPFLPGLGKQDLQDDVVDDCEGGPADRRTQAVQDGDRLAGGEQRVDKSYLPLSHTRDPARQPRVLRCGHLVGPGGG